MKKIFVPYDFSENAANTLLYALKLAGATGSEVTVFHALAISAKMMSSPVTEEKRKEVIEREERSKREELEKEVAGLLAAADSGLSPDTVVCKVTFGPIVVENIIYAAEEQQADLIVMGTHGASGLKKFLFGSVTSSTISKSSVPVLAVPMGHAYSDVKNIVYASDLENPEEELARILPFGRACQASIDVLHYNYGFDRQLQAGDVLSRYAADHVHLVVKKADSTVPLLKQIRQFIVETDPQWVVMFTQERSMWDKLFMGSKTEDMATDLQIPLLSFRKQ